MEVLAGRPDFNCEVKEHNCRFRFDFSRVYWNSRLQTEHARIVSVVGHSTPVVVSGVVSGVDSSKQSGEVVLCDMFCGIGPFAIPAVKNYPNVRVYANDLNPNSYYFLNENAKLNGV